MTELAALLVVLMMLACPVVMGAMILMMWRGMRHGKNTEPHQEARGGSLRSRHGR